MLLMSSYEPAGGCVPARYGSSQYPQFDPCSPQSPSSSVVEHPTRSRRVAGSNPIWESDFSESTFLLECTKYKAFNRINFASQLFLASKMWFITEACTIRRFQKIGKHLVKHGLETSKIDRSREHGISCFDLLLSVLSQNVSASGRT